MEIALLELGDLVLRLSLVARHVESEGDPYLDWLVCDLKVTEPAFSGAVRWNVMPSELSRLADDLQNLHDGLAQCEPVTFEPCEPNLMLSFCANAVGRIHGEYTVRADLPEGPQLTGHIHIDQSYLPTICSRLRRFVGAVIDAA